MDWLLGLILAMLFYRTYSLNQRIEALEEGLAEVVEYLEGDDEDDEGDQEVAITITPMDPVASRN